VGSLWFFRARDKYFELRRCRGAAGDESGEARAE
jgi:hypothetical protein